MKFPGVVEEFGVINDFSDDDGYEIEVRAMLLHFKDKTYLALKDMKSRRRSCGSNGYIHLVYFNDEGVEGLGKIVQAMKTPAAYESSNPSAEGASYSGEPSILKRIFRKLKDALEMPYIIKRFGVIGNLCDKANRLSCQVEAFIRKLPDQYILTLVYNTTLRGSKGGAWIDFDAKGIRRLERLIRTLKEEMTRDPHS